MVKAIIFDCWGTLFTVDQTPHPFSQIAARLGYTLSDPAFLKSFERHLMQYVYSDLELPIRALLDELRIPHSPSLIKELVQLLMDSISKQIAYADTEEVLGRLKDRYFLALLTNTFKQGYDGLDEKFDLDGTFDSVTTSFEAHSIKPDLQIFSAALTQIPYEPSEIVMVGDNLHDDIEPAQILGLKTLLVDRKNRYPNFEDRRPSLVGIEGAIERL